MQSIHPQDVQIFMAAGMFLVGMCAFLAGVAILVLRAWGRDIRSLTNQTSRLAQKGLAEDVAGLVGNASALLAIVNDMVRTATGIGVFLMLVGLGLMTLAYWLTVRAL